MKQTEYFKMISGELYKADDVYLKVLRAHAKTIFEQYNLDTTLTKTDHIGLLSSLFKHIGANATIEKPIYFDYGLNIFIGDNFFANYDCIFLDVAPITIGHNVLFGPRVSLYTAGHPTDVEKRNEGLEFGLPITIGDNVWIGGNSVINPGVTIGENSVIGAGSVVTKDIPPNVVAVGNPCRIIRHLK